MEKRRAAAIADNMFLLLSVWLLSYLWTRYYVMNLAVCLIAATGIALCVVMLINVRRNKNKLSRKKQKHIDNIMNQFLYGGGKFSLDFFHHALQNKLEQQTVKKERDGFLTIGKTAVFCRFVANQLSLQTVIDCYVLAKKSGAKRMMVLTLFGCDKQAATLLGQLPDIRIDVFDKNKSYDFLGWTGSFPNIVVVPRAAKPSIKSLLLGAFAKNKARNYLVISIVLLISSYFVIYSIYYIIAASVTFCLAIISRLDIAKRWLV